MVEIVDGAALKIDQYINMISEHLSALIETGSEFLKVGLVSPIRKMQLIGCIFLYRTNFGLEISSSFLFVIIPIQP